MKTKYFLPIVIGLFAIVLGVDAQNKMIVHSGGTSVYESVVTDMDSIKLNNNLYMYVYPNSMPSVGFSFSNIDSITFGTGSADSGSIVYITYAGSAVSVINPFSASGVTVTTSNADVTVTSTSTQSNIQYYVSGTSSDGSLKITTTNPIALKLSSLSLTSSTTAAINLVNQVDVSVELLGTSTLADGASSSINAALFNKGALTFTGAGTLNVVGNAKHGIGSSKSTVTVASGNIYITSAANDGFHSEGYIQNGGLVVVGSTVGDGVDASAAPVFINGGELRITSTTADVKGLKSDSTITINGGSITMTVSGNQSKGISSKNYVIFNGGTTNITASGTVVLEAGTVGYDPSYCSGVKADVDIIVNAGTINVTTTSTNAGGRCLTADRDIIINGGTVTTIAAGGGATYVNTSNATDAYSCTAIKSNRHIVLAAGTITSTSTGIGGKGISADSVLTIGVLGAANANLVLTVNTSGERFYVSGSGDNADYANPKAVKSEGNLTVNSGTITITCSQSQEGGEGMESKSTLTINGGIIRISAYDDCINASTHIAINGGDTYCVSRGNDGIDSNGTLTVTGGFTISSGTRAPEEGFDCDQNTFRVNGGIIIGTGGATSNPTASQSSQNSIKYTGTAGSAICVTNSSGTVILVYQMPTYSSSSTGGGPGGGNSSSMVLLYSDPLLVNGTYTLKYGGTITGGTNSNGYYTGATYTGGTSRSFTISSKLTTVQ